MRVAIDVRSIQYECNADRGIGQYLSSLLPALAAERPNWTFGLFVEFEAPSQLLAELESRADNLTVKTYNSLEDFSPDLFFISDFMSLIPGFESPLLFRPPQIPVSVLCYDFIPLKARQGLFDRWPLFMQHGYLSRLAQLRKLQPHYLAISESTSRDTEEILGVNQDSIDVILAGPNHIEHQLSDEYSQAVLRQHGIELPFFLAVGGQDSHKNFDLTLHGFLQLRQELRCQLVVAGSLADGHKVRYRDELQRLGVRDVLFTDYIESAALQALYRNATALCFPSRYEGFGFPVLEAMSLSCPVITTRCASIPEVAGEAVIYVSADAPDNMCSAMRSLLTDSDLRSRYRKRGENQSKSFSWETCSKKVIDAWTRLLSAKPLTRGVSNKLNTSDPLLTPDAMDYRFWL